MVLNMHAYLLELLLHAQLNFTSSAYLTDGNQVACACFVMPEKAHTQSWPLTSTARAFSMTGMLALLLAVICVWEAL